MYLLHSRYFLVAAWEVIDRRKRVIDGFLRDVYRIKVIHSIWRSLDNRDIQKASLLNFLKNFNQRIIRTLSETYYVFNSLKDYF